MHIFFCSTVDTVDSDFMSAWLSKDNEVIFVLFTAGIDLTEYVKTLGLVIARSLLLLFLIFSLLFMKPIHFAGH